MQSTDQPFLRYTNRRLCQRYTCLTFLHGIAKKADVCELRYEKYSLASLPSYYFRLGILPVLLGAPVDSLLRTIKSKRASAFQAAWAA